VYNDHVNTDMSYKDFSESCRNCWQQKYGFLVINKDNALTNGQKRFNEFAVPQLIVADISTLEERQYG